MDEQTNKNLDLAGALDRAKPLIADATQPTKKRIRLLWAAAKQARDLGTGNAIHDAFMALAVEANLIDAQGRWTSADIAEHRRRYGAQDVAHVLTWALRGWNPFETGPLT